MLMDVRAPLVKEPYFHRLVTCIFFYDPDMWCQRLARHGAAVPEVPGDPTSGSVRPGRSARLPQARVAVTDTLGRPFGGSAELDGHGNQAIPDVTARCRRATSSCGGPSTKTTPCSAPNSTTSICSPPNEPSTFKRKETAMSTLKVTSRSEITVQKQLSLAPAADRVNDTVAHPEAEVSRQEPGADASNTPTSPSPWRDGSATIDLLALARKVGAVRRPPRA